jgi:hypothetical protein
VALQGSALFRLLLSADGFWEAEYAAAREAGGAARGRLESYAPLLGSETSGHVEEIPRPLRALARIPCTAPGARRSAAPASPRWSARDGE